jgi:hypothetical protein
MPEPIKLTLYGQDDEELKTYERRIVPWGLLKKASRLAGQLDVGAEGAEGAEALISDVSQFVVEVFGGQFTVEELEAGADLGEILSVMQAIVSRASGMVKANPTLRPRASK